MCCGAVLYSICNECFYYRDHYGSVAATREVLSCLVLRGGVLKLDSPLQFPAKYHEYSNMM